MNDEIELVAGLRARQDWAFDAMLYLYSDRLLAVARRFTGNTEDAEDVLQSAYLSAFRAVSRFEGHCQLSTWLHRIVVNTALMNLRSRRRRPEQSIDLLLSSSREDWRIVERFSDWRVRPDALLEGKRTRATVRASIARLPAHYGVVITLRDLEERSTEEVARLLETTPAAIKVRLHRAHRALASLLRSEAGGFHGTMDTWLADNASIASNGSTKGRRTTAGPRPKPH